MDIVDDFGLLLGGLFGNGVHAVGEFDGSGFDIILGVLNEVHNNVLQFIDLAHDFGKKALEAVNHSRWVKSIVLNALNSRIDNFVFQCLSTSDEFIDSFLDTHDAGLGGLDTLLTGDLGFLGNLVDGWHLFVDALPDDFGSVANDFHDLFLDVFDDFFDVEVTDDFLDLVLKFLDYFLDFSGQISQSFFDVFDDFLDDIPETEYGLFVLVGANNSGLGTLCKTIEIRIVRKQTVSVFRDSPGRIRKPKGRRC